MPKIISHTPAWLLRPSAGFDLFASTERAFSNGSGERFQKRPLHAASTNDAYPSPRRTIATRGTEIFVVVGNTIRWTDLGTLKGDWDFREMRNRSIGADGDGERSPEGNSQETRYKVLKMPVHEQIQQLIPSPKGDLLAILTSHTVHIAILPDPSHLEKPDTAPIKVKTHTLGPTTHVLSQARVVSALWHPLGVNGECLVTITVDAVVRVWEFKRGNRWCFDEPKLAIDLKKLQHGTSAEDDFSAPKFGASRGFSVDALDMEVAAACFGGSGSDKESGWSSMTLWVAMSGGDVYALCPLLPSKWQPSAFLVPSLTTMITAKTQHGEEDEASIHEQNKLQDQYKWVAEIDKQESAPMAGEFEPRIYDRPHHPGPIPRLQGPFRFVPEDVEDDLELSDIRVTPPKIDVDELFDEEDDDFDISDSAGLSNSVVCLLTTNGRVLVCLDLDGVEGEWLPRKKTKSQPSTDVSERELLLLEAIDTLRPEGKIDAEWPTFSSDVQSPYSFFVTHGQGVYFLSMDEWVERLEGEVQNDSTEGTTFRMDGLAKTTGTLRERMIALDTPEAGTSAAVAASVVWHTPDLGYFLLTVSGEQPHAVVLDSKDGEVLETLEADSEHDYQPDLKLLTTAPVRPAFQPPPALFADTSITTILGNRYHGRQKKSMRDEIRLSAATMDIMNDAHRVLSHETQQLGVAAGAIFDRCEQLRVELQDQIVEASKIAQKIERLRDHEGHSFPTTDDGPVAMTSEQKMRKAKTRHQDLAARHKALRQKMIGVSGRDLSESEHAWVAEFQKLEASILEPEQKEGSGDNGAQAAWQRLAEVRTLANELVRIANDNAESTNASAPTTNGSFTVPPDIRKAKVTQVMDLLERETALVNAAQARLQRLSRSAVP